MTPPRPVPRSLPRAALGALLLAVGLLAGCGTSDAGLPLFDTPPGAQMTADEHAFAREVFDRVNQIRVANELPVLLWDETTADVAYDHAVDMRLRDYYDHVTPDGLTPVDRMERGGVDMDQFVAENLALGDETPEDVVNAWMASEGHRQAILSSAPTHLGVGVHTGREGPWWVQEFFVRGR